jgi:hypothetical protein
MLDDRGFASLVGTVALGGLAAPALISRRFAQGVGPACSGGKVRN